MIVVKHRYTGKTLLEVENLSRADLSRADLSGADLSGAYLSGADLSGAYLSGADLSRADLSGAYLSGADLSRAYLSGAYLSRANLSGANLSGAYLSRANLSGANLSGAYLSGANLSGAYLSGADLSKLQSDRLSIVPEVGAFVGWKKCMNGVIVKLQIPEDAARSNATGRKCRTEKVVVLEVIGGEFGKSQYDSRTEYRVGETVVCDTWGSDRWVECAGGIHFFLTRSEAENY